jgi:seryl-tRNA synthetase
MYKIEGEDSVLIATSEQSLAGAHGKDNQGLFRVHQFEKAEQFVICRE